MTELKNALPFITVMIPLALMAFLIYFSVLEPAEGKSSKASAKNRRYIYIILSAGMAARIAASLLNYGHEHPTDMNCFRAWSGMLADGGLSGFYASGSLTDYPPGYMYILLAAGWLRRIFNMGDMLFTTILKLPSFICDIGAAALIYKLARKTLSQNAALCAAAFYAFNPAAIADSALWGQVDAVYTLLIFAMLYCIYEKKYIPSYFLFGGAILVKLQALILTPILAFAVIEDFFLARESAKKILRNLVLGLVAVGAVFLVCVPFGIGAVIKQYRDTLTSYPYMTVNAFNIWNLLGFNWKGLDSLNGALGIFGQNGIPDLASVLGTLFIAAEVIICAVIYFRSKDRSKIFCLAAFLFLTSYMFSVRMHERYSFPALVMLLAAYCKKPGRRAAKAYILNTLFQFFAYAWVLYVYTTDINTYAFCSTQKVLSAINIALYCSFVSILCSALLPKRAAKLKPLLPADTQPVFTMSRTDKKAAAVITAVYSVFALSALGSLHAPQTVFTLTNEPVHIEFANDEAVERLIYYLGPSHLHEDAPIQITMFDVENNVVFSETLTDGSVFYANSTDVQKSVHSADISAPGERLYLMSLTFADKDGNAIMPQNAENYPSLFDEQELMLRPATYMNGTYFDEIYHARTAYEFIHGLSVYEWTHPPLGKIFISLGILVFGMCPFGWRITGTLIGIVMVPVVYAFVKKLFGKTWLSICGCLLYTFDFMHFAQTRIATIDVYVTFFIILMYCFMYGFYNGSLYAKSRKKTLTPLFLSGLCFGLGIASKWTALYAGAGLAVLWTLTLLRHFSDYRRALRAPDGVTRGISNTVITEEFIPRTVKVCLWCVVFFIVIPVFIYIVSYIPYMRCENSFSLSAIVHNQRAMYIYHSKTVAQSTHPYSSRWYQWLIIKRPIWYYSHTYGPDIKGGISSFGNPAVWWCGLIAFMFNIYLIIKKDTKALFLVIGYLAQLLPWIAVTRTTYIYHYFPAVIFLVLMIINSCAFLYDRARNKARAAKAVYIYTAAAVALFIMFLPVLNGMPVNVGYVNAFLKWFGSWVLI